MPNETLLMLSTEVRNKTLRLLEGVSEPDAAIPAPGLINTILWHAGHSLIVVEHLSVAPASGQAPVFPDGWFESFSWKSNPAAITKWPTLAEVVERLRDQLQRLTSAIEPLTPEKLASLRENGKTLRYSILHGLHDEAGHQGEVHLLKKMLKRRG